LQPAAIETDLVLLGAGHAHVEVLRRFALRPPEDLRVTLVAREPCAIYTGMLAGLIRGEYTRQEAEIDLAPLAAAAGARLVLAEATAIDREGRAIRLAGRPALPFDLLSIDVGGVPDMPEGAGIPARPIGLLPERIAALETGLIEGGRLAIVGGGAGGTELALALAARLGRRARLTLVCAEREPLSGAPGSVRALARAALVQAGVELTCGVTAGAPKAGRLPLSDGTTLEADYVIWATGAVGAPFLSASGLACDAAGCVVVAPTLRSVSDAAIFAAGDCASVEGAARPKGGVWAVRAGAVLAENLARAAAGRSLMVWKPQTLDPRSLGPMGLKRAAASPRAGTLSVIGLGGGRALAWRGEHWHLAGKSVARWKSRIDRRWVARIHALRPPAAFAGSPPAVAPGDGAMEAPALLPPAGVAVVQSIALLRAPIGDPFLFGQIAAAHALAPIHAMGARPWTALGAGAAAPASPRRMAADLAAMLAGAAGVFQAEGCTLSALRAAEAGETLLTFAVTGLGAPDRLWRPSRLRPGDTLILTKPLGTGIVLAGQSRGLTRAAWLQAATASMAATNAAAVAILRSAGTIAATAIAGLGLAGHLLEMLRASECTATLTLAALPALPGVPDLIARGVESPAATDNRRLLTTLPDDTREALLTDPQTSGGLLAAVPAANAGACIAALTAAGIAAARVGAVSAGAVGLVLE
jgi:selenide,water dikinase